MLKASVCITCRDLHKLPVFAIFVELKKKRAARMSKNWFINRKIRKILPTAVKDTSYKGLWKVSFTLTCLSGWWGGSRQHFSEKGIILLRQICSFRLKNIHKKAIINLWNHDYGPTGGRLSDSFDLRMAVIQILHRQREEI